MNLLSINFFSAAKIHVALRPDFAGFGIDSRSVNWEPVKGDADQFRLPSAFSDAGRPNMIMIPASWTIWVSIAKVQRVKLVQSCIAAGSVVRVVKWHSIDSKANFRHVRGTKVFRIASPFHRLTRDLVRVVLRIDG